MKIYKIFALALCALCARAALNAQLMETIAYSPLKKGSYEYLSTKSLTRLATDKDKNVTVNGPLAVNSATLFLKTNKVVFDSPVRVLNGVFARPDTRLLINNLTINGYFYANGGIDGSVAVGGSPLVSAKNIDAGNKDIQISAGHKIYINGIELERPICSSGKVGWRTYNNVTKPDGSSADNVKVFGCLPS